MNVVKKNLFASPLKWQSGFVSSERRTIKRLQISEVITFENFNIRVVRIFVQARNYLANGALQPRESSAISSS